MIRNLHGMRKPERIVLLSVLLLLLFGGCAKLPFLANFLGIGGKEESHTLLDDDFSDKDSGWGQFIYPEGSAGYENNAYQIAVNVPNSDIFITYPRMYINSVVEVNASTLSGDDNNNYGVICRYEDEMNFYAGQISSDGYAGILRVKNGNYQLIGREKMVPVPAILGGTGINHIRFECVEKSLTLIVNEEVADIQVDEAFTSGQVGLIAGTISDYYGLFQFDDFYADVP